MLYVTLLVKEQYDVGPPKVTKVALFLVARIGEAMVAHLLQDPNGLSDQNLIVLAMGEHRAYRSLTNFYHPTSLIQI